MRVVLIGVLFAILITSIQEWSFEWCDASSAAQNARTAQRQALDKQIAMRFSPLLYQGLGDSPRSDYITNFDFDGDWRGDNNWENLDRKSYPLRAYVYYSVIETPTHYFILYAIFHPRDYKGGLAESTLLDILISEGKQRAGKDPTGGLADELALSHENDLEGCLIVAEKHGQDLTRAIVTFVETMAHNHYFRYCPAEDRPGICESITMKDQRPLIFVEPKGHGPWRYTGDRRQLKDSVNGILVYTPTGRAEDPDQIKQKSIGYDLIPIYETLWIRAQHGENETYGGVLDYQSRTILKVQQPSKSAEKIEQKFGLLGSAFRGNVGFKNRARPPWAWFDESERSSPRGEWFFDPASVIARHFEQGQTFSTAYIYHPYFGVGL